MKFGPESPFPTVGSMYDFETAKLMIATEDGYDYRQNCKWCTEIAGKQISHIITYFKPKGFVDPEHTVKHYYKTCKSVGQYEIAVKRASEKGRPVPLPIDYVKDNDEPITTIREPVPIIQTPISIASPSTVQVNIPVNQSLGDATIIKIMEMMEMVMRDQKNIMQDQKNIFQKIGEIQDSIKNTPITQSNRTKQSNPRKPSKPSNSSSVIIPTDHKLLDLMSQYDIDRVLEEMNQQVRIKNLAKTRIGRYAEIKKQTI